MADFTYTPPPPSVLRANKIAVLETQLSAVQNQIDPKPISGVYSVNANAQSLATSLRSEGYGVSVTSAIRQGPYYVAYLTITSVPTPNIEGWAVGYRIPVRGPLQVTNPPPTGATLEQLQEEQASIESQLEALEATPAVTAATSPETTTAAPSNTETTTPASTSTKSTLVWSTSTIPTTTESASTEPTSTESTTSAPSAFASRWFAAFVKFLSFGDTKL